jgi:hypothetical protein
MGEKKFWVAFSIILAAIGLITLVILLSIKTTDYKSAGTPVKQELDIAANELDGITIIIPGSQKGSYWELKLAKCNYSSNIGHLININGEFFNSKKTVIYRISAQTGNLYWKTRILQLLGNVKFEMKSDSRVGAAPPSKRRELSADEVIWDPGTGKRAGVITARGQVTFRTADLTVNTTQVSTDLDFKRMIFSGTTKASFHK